MTKAQLLANADSLELTKWFVFFGVKAERDKKAVEDARFQLSIESGL